MFKNKLFLNSKSDSENRTRSEPDQNALFEALISSQMVPRADNSGTKLGPSFGKRRLGPSIDLQVDIKNVPILIEGKSCRGIIVAERDSETEDEDFEPGLYVCLLFVCLLFVCLFDFDLKELYCQIH